MYSWSKGGLIFCLRQTPLSIQPFKTFLHRNEQSGKTFFSRGHLGAVWHGPWSLAAVNLLTLVLCVHYFVCAAYSAGDVSTLLVSMAVPTVLGDTKLVFTDLLDEEEEPESYLPLSADLKV